MTPKPADDELAGWLRLFLAEGIGPRTQTRLLAEFGGPLEVLATDDHRLARQLNPAQLAALRAPGLDDDIQRTLDWATQAGNHLLTLGSPQYPSRLLDTPDPPILLHAKGDISLLNLKGIAMVGARSATTAGEDNAQAFARHLAGAGWCVVSGLALGIDAAAHRGALAAGGPTVAVIGTGADRIYPARNAALAREIAERGCVLSEYPLGTPPLAPNFPRRNRLIAGLTEGVLVVEAARGSGSLITARLAADLGREVFAIPGSIHSPLSRGCHQLIREGAKLVEQASDILEELGAPAAIVSSPTPATDAPSESPEHARAWAALGHDPVDMDTLSRRSNLTVDALYAILLDMELEGRIARLPGGRFQRR